MRIVCPLCQAVYQVDHVEPDTILVCHRCHTEFGFGEPPEDAEAVDEPTQEAATAESPVEDISATTDTAPETAAPEEEPTPEPVPEEPEETEDVTPDAGTDETPLPTEEPETAPAVEPEAEEEIVPPQEEEVEEETPSEAAPTQEPTPEPEPAEEPKPEPEPEEPEQEKEPEPAPEEAPAEEPVEPSATADEASDTPPDEPAPSSDNGGEEEAEEPSPVPIPEPEPEPKAKKAKGKASKKEKKERASSPRRLSVNIWPWLLGVLLIVAGAGLWFTHDIWLNNIWLRSTLINIGVPLQVRDKDWKIVPNSIHAKWVTRLDDSHVLVIGGVVENLMECKLPPPALRIKLYAKDAPSLVLDTRVMPITELPMAITIKRSPFIIPPVDRTPVAAKGERNFELVLDTLPDRVGDFSLSPVVIKN